MSVIYTQNSTLRLLITLLTKTLEDSLINTTIELARTLENRGKSDFLVVEWSY